MLIFYRPLAVLSIHLSELLIFEEDAFSWIRCFGEYAYLGPPGPCVHLAGIKLMTQRLVFILFLNAHNNVFSATGQSASCKYGSSLQFFGLLGLPCLLELNCRLFFFIYLCAMKYEDSFFSLTPPYMVTFYPHSS